MILLNILYFDVFDRCLVELSVVCVCYLNGLLRMKEKLWMKDFWVIIIVSFIIFFVFYVLLILLFIYIVDCLYVFVDKVGLLVICFLVVVIVIWLFVG